MKRFKVKWQRKNSIQLRLNPYTKSLSIPGIHSYIEVAKTAVGNIVCSYSYQVHRLTEKWRLSSGPSVTKPFIAQHLPVI